MGISIFINFAPDGRVHFYMAKLSIEDKNADLKEIIQQIFDENHSRYGYRPITLELKNRGIKVNHKKVKRLMKLMGLYAVIPKRKYKSYKGDMNGTVKNLLLDILLILVFLCFSKNLF